MKTAAMCAALAGVLTIGGISAYFTDADTATNEFTVGKVSIDLQEPNFDEDAVEVNEVTPGLEIKKDPKIVNTGKNEAYGFLKVVVPYKEVVTADEEGNADAAASYKELFTYNVNDGWIELEDYKEVSEQDGTVTHIYAYAADEATMTAIADADANGATATLFDYVKLINLVEGNLEENDLQIDVTAYAIQTSNLKDATGTPDGTDGDLVNGEGTNDTITDASDIWDIIVNASPSTTQEAEGNSTDILGASK